MTKLTINICAEDDRSALRVLKRLQALMEMDCFDAGLSESGYTTGHVDGSSNVMVIRILDTANSPLNIKTIGEEDRT